MKLRLFVGLILGLAWPATLPAASADEAFERGNAAFVSGQFAAAIQDYQTCLGSRGYSAALLYNLANALFRDGKIGPAILNYERALWLAPGDPDIKANLQIARRSAGLFEAAPPSWQVVAALFSLNTWTWLAAVVFLLLCLTSIIRMFKLDVRWSARPWLVVFTLLWLLCVSSMALRWMDLNRAVVTVADTQLRITPLDSSPSVFNLPAGSIVAIRKERDGFFYIHSPDGKEGWVSQKQAERIIPSVSMPLDVVTAVPVFRKSRPNESSPLHDQ